MIADILEKPLDYEPLWNFEYLNDERKRFKLFNIEQIQAVIHFIEYVLDRDSEYDFEMNKHCGVDEEYNLLLHKEHLEKIQNTDVLLEWKQFLEEKQK